VTGVQTCALPICCLSRRAKSGKHYCVVTAKTLAVLQAIED
jgi:hypothetical protein